MQLLELASLKYTGQTGRLETREEVILQLRPKGGLEAESPPYSGDLSLFSKDEACPHYGE